MPFPEQQLEAFDVGCGIRNKKKNLFSSEANVGHCNKFQGCQFSCLPYYKCRGIPKYLCDNDTN